MDKNNIKDNILRFCYHKRNLGVGKEELRNSITNDKLLDECCDELECEGYLSYFNFLYRLTPKGEIFVFEKSFSFPSMPIVQYINKI